MKNYFVFGFPCSGTAWLANFLTWGESFCFHDITHGVESLDEMAATFGRMKCASVGSADTAGLLVLPKLRQRFPDAKVLFVLRDAAEVKIDLATVGFDVSGVDQLGKFLSEAISDPTLDSAVMRYEDIFSSTMMRQVWDFLEIPGKFPWRRFELLRAMQIEDTARTDPTTAEARDLLMNNMATFDRLIANTFPPQRQADGVYSGVA